MRSSTGTVRARAELRDMWQTRPARPRADRKIAGVAAAIGQRYDVDPLLVRIAFVVAAFYGPGIPLYLAGCAALPDAGSARRPGRGQGAALVATVLVAAAAVVSALVLLGVDGQWFLPMLACLGLLVALHLTRGRRGPAGGPGGYAATGADAPTTVHDPVHTAPADPTLTGDAGRIQPTADVGYPLPTGAHGDVTAATTGGDATTAPDTAFPDTAQQETATPDAATQTTATQEAAPQDAAARPGTPGPTVPTGGAPADRGASPPTPAPPSWDPLGAAPFAWDLPEPGPEPAPPAARRSRITPVTLGVALVVAGIVAVLALTAPGALGVASVPATALAVVGTGLVIGAFRHAGRWLIPFALVLAAATWLAAAVPWPDLRDGVGDISVAPQTAAALAPEYRKGAGDITLDLRRLDLTAAPGTPATPVRTSAQLGIGTVTVLVPRDADLKARAEAGVGDVELDGRTVEGSPAEMTATDPGPDGPGGRTIELDLHAGVGSVEVTRG
ncbi:MAG: PspC domain-containing protein [Pseudonocardia sp.]|nr:PspC domain-containing protein [Pseudonocardia sp.]